MPLLSARYSVACAVASSSMLAHGCVENEALINIDAFVVKLRLCGDPASFSANSSDGLHSFEALKYVEVTATRNEGDAVPSIDRGEDAVGLVTRREYLGSRNSDYRAAAIEATNRLLRFFKYALHCPLVQLAAPNDSAFRWPTWIDERGFELDSGVLFAVSKLPTGTGGKLRARPLSVEDWTELKTYVTEQTEPSLQQALLSDAQNAWYSDDLRRAVVDIAIAAEVMVKRRYFTRDSAAGVAFDYLEDKARVSVRVLELIDQISSAAFGSSFKSARPVAFQHIDHLFRCRNKVVHRGELTFRDDAGATYQVSKEDVANWWEAAQCLDDWLRTLSAAP